MTGGGWALTAEGLSTLLEEVGGGRELIVECGSGESTVAIARMLAQRASGRLYALEHDPGWHAETAARLRAEGLGERVELLEAPLRDGWYDRDAAALIPDGIDLLLVDGPPGDTDPSGQARYPALPALADRLEPGAIVILDDIQREGEQRVVDRWERELPIRFERQPEKRLAIGVFSGADMADFATARERE